MQWTQAKFWFLAAVCIFGFGLVVAESQGADTTGLAKGTGLVYTPAEDRYLKKNFKRITKVFNNALAVQRINAGLSRRSRPLLSSISAVKAGNEMELSASSVRPALFGVMGGLMTVSLVSVGSAADTLPTAVDNSTLIWFPPIGDQGGLGSCASFSVTYYQLSYMVARDKNIAINNPDWTNKYSPKWVYNMVNYGADGGSYWSTVYETLAGHGAPTWSEWPYDSDYLAWPMDVNIWRRALNVRTNLPVWVDAVSSDTGLTLVKQLLTNGYILIFGTYINSWQYTTIKDNPSTTDDTPFIGQKVAFWTQGLNGAHSMTLVGYNDNLWVDINVNGVVDAGELGALKIANSWGGSWGNGGFMWLAYDALRTVSKVTGAPTSERYGAMVMFGDQAGILTVKSNYTPKLLGKFTLNHAMRDQIWVRLGIGDQGADYAARTIWYPGALQQQGGAYAFDGGTVPRDGTFIFDLTDILPSVTAASKFYLTVMDTTGGNLLQVKNFSLVNPLSGADIAVATDVPIAADAADVYSTISYTYPGSDLPPVSKAEGFPTVGTAPVTVSFLGVASYDPDGRIIKYDWDFGDGSAHATTVNAVHTYSAAGTFTARLTVTDNQNVSAVSPGIPVIVSVSGIVPVINFSVSPTLILEGQTATLNWTTFGAHTCIASEGWTGSQALSGAEVVSPLRTQSYVLSCTGTGGTVTQTASVSVIPATQVLTVLPVANGTITPSSITVNRGTDQTFTIVPDPGYMVADVTVDGLSVGALTAYTFTNIQADHSIYAMFRPVPVPGLTLTASPQVITSGSSTALTWSAVNVSSCTASGGWTGSKALAGTLSVNPAATTTYALECSGPGGTVIRSVTVTVNPATFVLTVVQAAGGTISPATTTVVQGASQTFAIRPNSGYKVDSVTVDGVSVGAVATYTFSNVMAAHTITAVFSAGSLMAPKLTFSATPTTIIKGETAVLNWASTGADACVATGGWSGNVALSGTYRVTPAVSTGYSLKCSNAAGAVSVAAAVSVKPKTFTVTASIRGSGTISPAGAIAVVQGGMVTFIAKPATGQKVISILQDGVPVMFALGSGWGYYTLRDIQQSHDIVAVFDGGTAPVIGTQPAAQTGIAGQTATFTVTASGSAPLTYQWQKNGVNIAGAVAASYTTPVLAASDNGSSYRVIVTNSTGSVTSSAALLTVQAMYKITVSSGVNGSIAPGTTTAAAGSSVNFTITPSTGYKVEKVSVDGVPVESSTVYTFSSLQANHTLSATFMPISVPALTLTASPSVITTGQSAVISWTGVNLTACTASGSWSGTRPVSGSITVRPVETSIYTLDCSGTGGAETRSVTVMVNPAPQLNLTADQTAISSGASAVLNWDTANVTSCLASGAWTGAKSLSGTFMVTPAATATYSMTCTGAGGLVIKSVTVAVNPVTYTLTVLPAVNGKISPATITVARGVNQTFTITPNAGFKISSVTVDGVAVGAVASYTFSNVQAAHTIAASFIATALSVPRLTFTANPTTITSGDTAVLNWASTGAYACVATGGWSGNVALSGTYRVTPAVSTGYSLKCSNAAGAVSVAAVVTVKPRVFMLTASVSGSGTISPMGVKAVAQGGLVTYVAKPATGQVLQGMLVDGLPVKYSVSSGWGYYTVRDVQANHTVQAVFGLAGNLP